MLLRLIACHAGKSFPSVSLCIDYFRCFVLSHDHSPYQIAPVRFSRCSELMWSYQTPFGRVHSSNFKNHLNRTASKAMFGMGIFVTNRSSPTYFVVEGVFCVTKYLCFIFGEMPLDETFWIFFCLVAGGCWLRDIGQRHSVGPWVLWVNCETGSP